MMLQHTPLDAGALSGEVQRALSSPATKMMAARGLAPIANPGDLITLFYQLVCDQDQNIKTTAHKAAGELPDHILAAALADYRLDPRVLDYYTTAVLRRQDLIQAVILNPAVADETIETIAKRGGTREIELVATNQQRLLRRPEIICAMWMNDAALQATVDKSIELAIHNNVEIPGFPQWEEYKRQILESGKRQEAAPDDGTAVAAAISRGEEGALRELSEAEVRKQSEKAKRWTELDFKTKMRRAFNGSGGDREEAIRDGNKVVALMAIRSPMVKEADAARWATNSSLPLEVISYIAGKREWTKMYSVKLALCQNPKTPIKETARLVSHLREKDLKNLSRSKGIPSAVAAQAKKLLMQRASGRSGRR